MTRESSSRLVLLASLACLAACTGTPTTSVDHSADPGPLKAGAGQHVIELPIGHATAGYAQSPLLAQYKPSDDPGSPFADMFPATRGMQSPPTAKVTVLDNGHSRIVFAKIDAVFTTDILTERVVQLAQSMLHENIAHQLLLNATHTHDAGCRFSRASLVPDLAQDLDPPQQNALAHGVDTYSQESTDRVARSIVLALKDALANLKPAKFGYAVGSDDKAGHDRRCANDWKYGPNDHQKDVTVIRIDDAATGAPISVMFNYGMHGTIYSQKNRMLSVDAPGHAEYKLEELFDKPLVAMYLQGAAGDASPSGHGNDGSQAMQWAGWELAQTVKATYDSIVTSDAPIVLQSADRWVAESHDAVGYKKDEFFQDGAILCWQLAQSNDCATGPVSTDPSVIDRLCPTLTVDGEGKYQTRIATARIGDLAVMTLPGEPMASVGRELQARGLAEGFKHVMVMGYAQDHNGYILFDEDWLSGGYEPTISFWGWKFGTFIVNESQKLLHDMVAKNAKQPDVALPNLAPDAYTPAKVSEAKTAPGVASIVMPAQVERLQAVSFSFYGGDPIGGTPEIVLQQKGADGSFATVMKHGWLPVSNLRGYELPVTYVGDPSYAKDPTATSRTHTWTVTYEPPFDLPTGWYRFHVTGPVAKGGQMTTFTVDSSNFQIVPSTHLTLDLGVNTTDDGKLVVDATVLYPAKKAEFAPNPNPDTQVANWRLIDPRFAMPFAPVTENVTITGAVVVHDGDTSPLDASFVARDIPDAESYEVGQGPGIHAEFDMNSVPATPQWGLNFPAGSVKDAYGNTTGEDFGWATPGR